MDCGKLTLFLLLQTLKRGVASQDFAEKHSVPTFLSLKGGCTDSPESTLVKMPRCWKPHVAAYFSKAVLTTSGNFWRPWNLRFSICKSLRCKLYLFWPYSLLEVVSLFKKYLSDVACIHVIHSSMVIVSQSNYPVCV